MLTVLIAAGCVSTPTTTLPDWELAVREETEIAYPIELPVLCEIPSEGRWSTECWLIFVDKFEVIAIGNTEIARGNADALRKTEQAYDQLIEAGKLQQQLAQIRQQLLDDERQQRTYDRWYYRAIIVGLIVAGAAL